MGSRGENIRVMYPLFQVGKGGSIPTSPLSMQVELCDVDFAVRMNNSWHSVLPKLPIASILIGRHQAYYAALHDNVCYAVAIFTDPVNRSLAADGETLELRRLAIAPDAPKELTGA